MTSLVGAVTGILTVQPTMTFATATLLVVTLMTQGVAADPSRRLNPTRPKAFDYAADAERVVGQLHHNFSCDGREYGYYADQGQQCQVFHICMPVKTATGRILDTFQFSFFCPTQTLFSQDSRTCISEARAFPCHKAHTLYDLNKAIGQSPNKKKRPVNQKRPVPGSSFKKSSFPVTSNTNTGVRPLPQDSLGDSSIVENHDSSTGFSVQEGVTPVHTDSDVAIGAPAVAVPSSASNDGSTRVFAGRPSPPSLDAPSNDLSEDVGAPDFIVPPGSQIISTKSLHHQDVLSKPREHIHLQQNSVKQTVPPISSINVSPLGATGLSRSGPSVQPQSFTTPATFTTVNTLNTNQSPFNSIESTTPQPGFTTVNDFAFSKVTVGAQPFTNNVGRSSITVRNKGNGVTSTESPLVFRPIPERDLQSTSIIRNEKEDTRRVASSGGRQQVQDQFSNSHTLEAAPVRSNQVNEKQISTFASRARAHLSQVNSQQRNEQTFVSSQGASFSRITGNNRRTTHQPVVITQQFVNTTPQPATAAWNTAPSISQQFTPPPPTTLPHSTSGTFTPLRIPGFSAGVIRRGGEVLTGPATSFGTQRFPTVKQIPTTTELSIEEESYQTEVPLEFTKTVVQNNDFLLNDKLAPPKIQSSTHNQFVESPQRSANKLTPPQKSSQVLTISNGQRSGSTFNQQSRQQNNRLPSSTLGRVTSGVSRNPSTISQSTVNKKVSPTQPSFHHSTSHRPVTSGVSRVPSTVNHSTVNKKVFPTQPSFHRSTTHESITLGVSHIPSTIGQQSTVNKKVSPTLPSFQHSTGHGLATPGVLHTSSTIGHSPINKKASPTQPSFHHSTTHDAHTIFTSPEVSHKELERIGSPNLINNVSPVINEDPQRVSTQTSGVFSSRSRSQTSTTRNVGIPNSVGNNLSGTKDDEESQRSNLSVSRGLQRQSANSRIESLNDVSRTSEEQQVINRGDIRTSSRPTNSFITNTPRPVTRNRGSKKFQPSAYLLQTSGFLNPQQNVGRNNVRTQNSQTRSRSRSQNVNLRTINQVSAPRQEHSENIVNEKDPAVHSIDEAQVQTNGRGSTAVQIPSNDKASSPITTITRGERLLTTTANGEPSSSQVRANNSRGRAFGSRSPTGLGSNNSLSSSRSRSRSGSRGTTSVESSNSLSDSRSRSSLGSRGSTGVGSSNTLTASGSRSTPAPANHAQTDIASKLQPQSKDSHIPGVRKVIKKKIIVNGRPGSRRNNTSRVSPRTPKPEVTSPRTPKHEATQAIDTEEQRQKVLDALARFSPGLTNVKLLSFNIVPNKPQKNIKQAPGTTQAPPTETTVRPTVNTRRLSSSIRGENSRLTITTTPSPVITTQNPRARSRIGTRRLSRPVTQTPKPTTAAPESTPTTIRPIRRLTNRARQRVTTASRNAATTEKTTIGGNSRLSISTTPSPVVTQNPRARSRIGTRRLSRPVTQTPKPKVAQAIDTEEQRQKVLDALARFSPGLTNVKLLSFKIVPNKPQKNIKQDPGTTQAPPTETTVRPTVNTRRLSSSSRGENSRLTITTTPSPVITTQNPRARSRSGTRRLSRPVTQTPKPTTVAPESTLTTIRPNRRLTSRARQRVTTASRSAATTEKTTIATITTPPATRSSLRGDTKNRNSVSSRRRILKKVTPISDNAANVRDKGSSLASISDDSSTKTTPNQFPEKPSGQLRVVGTSIETSVSTGDNNQRSLTPPPLPSASRLRSQPRTPSSRSSSKSRRLGSPRQKTSQEPLTDLELEALSALAQVNSAFGSAAKFQSQRTTSTSSSSSSISRATSNTSRRGISSSRSRSRS